MAEERGAGVEHRHLRSALEFAVLMAAEGQKRKPTIPYPKELRPFFNKARLPGAALGRLRRVIEADPVFRERLAAGALPELVDEVGRVWLTHGDDWEVAALGLVADVEAERHADDLATQLKRAEKRRDAAEQAAVRAQAELIGRDEFVQMQSTEIDELRAELIKAEETNAAIRTELLDVRMDVRHARDREAAAVAKAATANDQLADAQRQLAAAVEPGTAPLAVVHPERDSAADKTAEVAAAAASARALADQLDAIADTADTNIAHSSGAEAEVGAGATTRRRPARRTALRLPGGVIASSAEAAAHLARSDAQLLIDGYNVAKLGWPNRPLERQRTALLDALENLARRFGTDTTVIFDGASIVGAHADRRRLVRVVYSPDGTIADDVIRDEVSRLPTNRAVVVVTNDAEIVRDVRADGANVVPSNALLAIL